MIKNNFLVLLAVLMVSSCKKSLPENGDDLIEFVKNEDNGYSQTKVINGITINLTYRPTPLMVSQEMEALKLTAQSKKDSIKKKYDNFLYFLLSYSKEGKEILSTVPASREQFNTIQNNLTFGMNNFVSLTNKKDTIPLVDFSFPRTYGMARSTNLLFIFNRKAVLKKNGEVSFNVKDVGIDIGDITFKFPVTLIKAN